MSIQHLILELLISIPLTLGIFYFILKNWIINVIQYSVKSQYDKQLEEFKNSISTRTRASLVADLLSEWLSFPEDQKLLNKLSFEAFLWLPKEIAIDLSNLLSHQPQSKSVREIISEVRKHLLTEGEAIEPHNVIVFTQKFRKKIQEEIANKES